MRISLIAAGLWICGTVHAADVGADRFESRIRPVLADHCWKCHGATKQSSGLRLDSREAILKGGDAEGAAIVPGKPDESPLLRAVRHSGELKMPPKSRLSESAVADLSDWIKAGAPWPKAAGPAASVIDPSKHHWAFQPIRTPAIAPGKPFIDVLINAELAKKSLAPGPRADRRTLIRRAAFDLTGLPPTPDDVEAFLGDARPDSVAFADVIDRLLGSPHYGERWGRHWLDVARYADTKGYVFNEDKNYPFSYTYRDWVVAALNEDMPYDQFVLRQVAGDRLPKESDNRQLAGMGFLTVGRRFLQDQNEIIDDRIDVVTRGLLGLSVTCARCHDHKFDPIPTEDYYSLYGVFAGSEEPKELPILSPALSKTTVDYQRTLAERRKAIDTLLNSKRTEIEKELRSRFSFYLQAADSVNFDPRAATFDEVVKTKSLRPEALRRLIMRWKELQMTDDPLLAPWKTLTALPVGDWKGKASAVLAGSKAPAALVSGLTATPLNSRSALAVRYGDLLSRALVEPADPAFAEVRRLLDAPGGPIKMVDADMRRILSREDRNRLRELEKKVAELDMSHPGAPSRAMVMVDKAQPFEPRVFLRGNPGRPGPLVPRRFLKVISTPERPPFKNGSGRLDLAQSIVRPDNPLTSRVMVNRIWMGHFGYGLVRTPSDFGTRGDLPTHPVLLDALASTFINGGWSIKAMHRLIMNSDAYARSSVAVPEMLRIDPENLLLARQNRRRLDFETMRDALLAVAGRLDPSIGGKPVRLEAQPFPTRRTLYGFIDRQNLEPVYRTFDFPNPDTSSPRRVATIVPQQALYLMNSPFTGEQARALASRREVGSGTPDARIRGLYRLLFDRRPEPNELAIGLRYVSQPAEEGDEGPTSPWSYGTGGVVETKGKPALVTFQAFPHWTGKAWQNGPKLPTDDGNFASLHADGGHPGPDAQRSTVVRWVAPADATVAISGMLGQTDAKGDGIRARVVSSRAGILGTWDAHAKKTPTSLEKVAIKRGEILYFVVDCKAEPSFDSYAWNPTLRLVGPAPDGLRRASWVAKADFHGPEPAVLNPWQSYAQALVLSNEFMYID